MLFCCSFLMGLMEKSCQKWSKLLCMSSCAFTQGEYSGCTNKIVAYYPALLTRMFACSFFLFKKNYLQVERLLLWDSGRNPKIVAMFEKDKKRWREFKSTYFCFLGLFFKNKRCNCILCLFLTKHMFVWAYFNVMCCNTIWRRNEQPWNPWLLKDI